MKTFFVKYFTRWDLEEVLLAAGLVLLMVGLWITYGPGPALAVTGGYLLTLGSVIAFWR